MIENLRPLTQEQRQAARKAAREAVIRAIGPKLMREQFMHTTISPCCPASVACLIWLLCWVPRAAYVLKAKQALISCECAAQSQRTAQGNSRGNDVGRVAIGKWYTEPLDDRPESVEFEVMICLFHDRWYGPKREHRRKRRCVMCGSVLPEPTPISGR